MEQTLEQVEKHCSLELMNYQTCVFLHSKDWLKSCIQQKNALTICSEKNVAFLKDMKEKCSNQIENYNVCLSQNKNKPSLCLNELKKLYDCTKIYSDIKLK
ncbi:uncharacterized protein T551_03355 [Pneumocystis jirovecii RU7]|uniref:IMS import disulfide relay-system CHCH-CHCH-like Cx9C domain-containing protein n=1 Tax=Pneumocystis jirovecii (strain RU7) TaxID=1408657 RepID=A0A0W4ZET9_PNEJ7|nr:uncharacterized protein T551_03355 [Pneumocystis jirovecii RU7]KTW26893.1 hypothetical protein T551_03355 [Pneumocystis jirovecii RU7]